MTPAERARWALPCAFEDDDLPRDLIPLCSHYDYTSDEFPERCLQYVCPFRYRRRVEREIREAEDAARAAERARVLRLLEQARAEFVAVSALRDAIADGREEL